MMKLNIDNKVMLNNYVEIENQTITILRILDLLKTEQMILLVGAAGTGKTTLFRVIANDFSIKSRYDEVIWWDWSRKTDIIDVDTLIKTKLKTLVMIDDYYEDEQFDDIIISLVKNQNIKVIVNSRISQFPITHHTVFLGPMSRTDMQYFLNRIINYELTEPQVQSIISKSAGNPLILKLLIDLASIYKDNTNELRAFIESVPEDYNIAYENDGGLRMFTSIGKYFIEKSDYQKGTEWLAKSVEISNEINGSNNEITFSLMTELANAYTKLGMVDQSIKTYERILNECSDFLKNDSISYSKILNNYGLLLSSIGDVDTSKHLFEEALEIYHTSTEKLDINLASTYNNLAILYMRLGNYKTAINYLEISYKIQQDINAEDSSITLITLSYIGEAYKKLGEFEKSLYILKRLVKKYIEMVGENHRYTILAMNNLASVSSEMGDYETAVAIYKKSINIIKDSLNIDSKTMSVMYNNLAGVLTKQMNFSEALIYYQEALLILDSSNASEAELKERIHLNIEKLEKVSSNFLRPN